jgi:hypothetical protein
MPSGQPVDIGLFRRMCDNLIAITVAWTREATVLVPNGKTAKELTHPKTIAS